jgi:hypothetical protein
MITRDLVDINDLMHDHSGLSSGKLSRQGCRPRPSRDLSVEQRERLSVRLNVELDSPWQVEFSVGQAGKGHNCRLHAVPCQEVSGGISVFTGRRTCSQVRP